jgi:hypothetical protein
MVALVSFADLRSRRRTGDSITKRLDRAISPFWDPSDTCAKKRSCRKSIVSALVQQRRP